MPPAPLHVAIAWSALLLVPKIRSPPLITVNAALPAVVLSLKLASALLTVIVASAAVDVSKKNRWPGKIPMLLITKLALPADADPLKETNPPLAAKEVRFPAVP